jgi:hypothetical protein
MINAIDLRTLDRHHDAAVTSLIPLLSCRSCRPNAPFAELVRLSRKSIADEMREEHRRRVLGEDHDRPGWREEAGEVILPGCVKGKQNLVAPTCLLSPFPLTSPLIVICKTALNHFGAPLIARHDEGSEAAAEAKRAERHHKAEL